MLAVILVSLSAVKLLTVIPEPKFTALASVRLVPVMATSRASPILAEAGFTDVIVGAAGSSSPAHPLSIPAADKVTTNTSAKNKEATFFIISSSSFLSLFLIYI
jgi:hypothetical protein